MCIAHGTLPGSALYCIAVNCAMQYKHLSEEIRAQTETIKPSIALAIKRSFRCFLWERNGKRTSPHTHTYTKVQNRKNAEKITFLSFTFPRVSEVSERANVRANERTDERVAQYLRLYSCLFQTTVRHPPPSPPPPSPLRFDQWRPHVRSLGCHSRVGAISIDFSGTGGVVGWLLELFRGVIEERARQELPGVRTELCIST